MKTLAIMLVFLVGCTDGRPAAPAVHVIALRDQVLDPEIVPAMAAWEPLGFDVSAIDSGLVECDLRWYADGQTDCQITIGVARDPQLIEKQRTGALSYRDSREAWIDTRTSGIPLFIAAAHEAGHILLDTDRHTAGGIMGGADDVMYQVDRDLACDTIHICI